MRLKGSILAQPSDQDAAIAKAVCASAIIIKLKTFVDLQEAFPQAFSLAVWHDAWT